MSDSLDARYTTEEFRGYKRLNRGYCPHCDHRVAFLEPPNGSPSWSFDEQRDGDGEDPEETVRHTFVIGLCPSTECGKPTIVYEVVSWYHAYHADEHLDRCEVVYPQASGRTIHAEEIPEDLRLLFAEAGRIEALSPNGAAFLARRILERVLRERLQSKKKLFKLIDQYLEDETLPPDLHQLMHDVRQFGNIAGHPGTTAEGDIIDVEAGEASYVLNVVSELLDFVYVRPLRQKEMRTRWQKKSKGERPEPGSLAAGITIERSDRAAPEPSSDPDDDLPF